MLIRAVFHVKLHCSKRLRLFHVKHYSQVACRLSDQQMVPSGNQEMAGLTADTLSPRQRTVVETYGLARQQSFSAS